jgi:hypothetical protein
MRQLIRRTVLVGIAAGLVATPGVASAQIPAVSTFEYTQNMHPLGFSAREIPLDNTVPGAGVFNSDLAFQGNVAVQGTYAGFRLVDVSDPEAPKEIINWTECASNTNTVGNQGDVIIWGDLLIRSWNSATPAPVYPAGHPMAGQTIPTTDPLRYTTPGAFCGDWPMYRVLPTPTHPVNPPAVDRGQEGVHVIDISDPTDPEVIGFVDTPCGSHTETLVPDLAHNRLLVYSNPSSNTTFGSPEPGSEPVHCRGFDMIEVPLDDPSATSYLKFVPGGHPDDPVEELHPCHDTGVILGDVMKAACAGGSGPTVWSLDPADGGALDDPEFLFHRDLGTSIGHTASWSWDGKVLIFGHEPGGGGQAQCQASSSVLNRTLFFLDGETGSTLGTFVHPRPQTALENCTWHNLNVVPTDKGYVGVSGNYQSGISVFDFTGLTLADPTPIKEIAYADPAPLINPNNPAALELGGDWSTYWYNGLIYESDITRGLIIWRLSDLAVAGAKRLARLNPQTQEISIPLKGTPFPAS